MAKLQKASREAILGADDRKTKEVPVPEWGVNVTIRQLSYVDYARIGMSLSETGEKDPTFMARYVVASIIDEESGERMFSDDDVPALAQKSRNAIRRLWDAVAELNGLVPRDEAVKN